MTVVMSTVASHNPEWQPGYVPKLSFRNPAPIDTTVSSASGMSNETTPVRAAGAGTSIREIRQNMPRSPSTSSARPPLSPQLQNPKKKSGILSGFFSKEPSSAALDQVAAQMMAQKGSISPTTIPYVSSQKMPDHVPKVNSRWDGVPDYVKQREKEVKEQQRAINRLSRVPTVVSPRGMDGPCPSFAPHSASVADSQDSWDSRSVGSRPEFGDSPSLRPTSIYSSSSGETDHAANSFRPRQSPSLKSPSGSSLPEIVSFLPTDIVPTADSSIRVPSIMSRSSERTHNSQTTATSYSTTSSEKSRAKVFVPPIHVNAIPEHTFLIHPGDRSPGHLSTMPDGRSKLGDERQKSSKKPSTRIIPAPKSAKRVSSPPSPAFLANEARPLQLSSDEDEIPSFP